MIDLTELETYAKGKYSDKTKIIWELEYSQEDFFDLIFGYLGECLSPMPNKKQAERAVSIIMSATYYYLYGVENKSLTKAKDKFRKKEKAVIKKTDDFIDILWDDFPNGTEGSNLLLLLNDMKKNPFKYAKAPKHVPEYEFTREYVYDQIILALSQRLDQNKYVNSTKKFIKELPK